MIDSSPKKHIQKFWGSLYDSLYEGLVQYLTKDQLLKSLIDPEDMFRFREHMAVTDIKLETLPGKHVLEIGPGAGGAFCTFC